jgi:hypothetical protein
MVSFLGYLQFFSIRFTVGNRLEIHIFILHVDLIRINQLLGIRQQLSTSASRHTSMPSDLVKCTLWY